jgi:rod shape-determining protein MreB
MTEHVKSVLEQIPPQISADVYESGMTLCGGTALLPGIDRYFAEKLGMTVNVTEQPELCVLRGTETLLASSGELLQVVCEGEE